MLPSSHADTRKKRVAFKALLGEVDLTFDQPEGQEPPHAAMDEVRRRLAGVSRQAIVDREGTDEVLPQTETRCGRFEHVDVQYALDADGVPSFISPVDEDGDGAPLVGHSGAKPTDRHRLSGHRAAQSVQQVAVDDGQRGTGVKQGRHRCSGVPAASLMRMCVSVSSSSLGSSGGPLSVGAAADKHASALLFEVSAGQVNSPRDNAPWDLRPAGGPGMLSSSRMATPSWYPVERSPFGPSGDASLSPRLLHLLSSGEALLPLSISQLHHSLAGAGATPKVRRGVFGPSAGTPHILRSAVRINSAE
ncbi:hypothetical protein CF327_g7329 [Tilletia walkeri]|nr:hypothetical protein CF327_g7329 [Tilletia walkeri]